jgi:6-pyruvoyltetrahydropterin/6-carboxytetrahydropterin synthase
MFTVTKSFKIPIGHRLSKVKNHRCSSFHGHNIKIDVEIQREKLNNEDMVLDFYRLKEIVNLIIDEWDHAMIINHSDLKSVENLNLNQRLKICQAGDPTSENMCFILYNTLYEQFKTYDPELKLKSITIWESDESNAKYEPK